jgi:uncharacterized membrane protein YjfL (UPF0719 family)
MVWQTIIFVCVSTTVLLAVARFVNQIVMSTSMTDSLINRDNPAMGIEIAGYLLGVILIISAVLSGPGHDTLQDNIMWVSIYGIGGILFLSLVATLGLRLILSKKCLQEIRDGNIAVGIVSAGSYVGTAAVIAGSVTGEGSGNWTSTLVFFLAGQLSFLLITYIFRLLTSYDDTKEVLDKNISAALSYAGLMISVGLIVGDAIKGDFISYEKSLLDFGKSLLVVVALYPIRQWLVQGLLLGGGFSLYGGRLDEEISKDRNINAGVIEAVTYISTAVLVTGLL